MLTISKSESLRSLFGIFLYSGNISWMWRGWFSFCSLLIYYSIPDILTMLTIIPSIRVRTLRTMSSTMMTTMRTMHMSSPIKQMTSLIQRTPISSPTAYTQPMLVTNIHTSSTVNKETKTKIAEKEKETPAMSNILEAEEH